MEADQELIKKIKTLGLNTYEVKIWTALLSRGVSTAGELSDIANVPRSRSYDVLESLEKKGFVAMKLGKPIKYMAIPPKEVLERVKKQIQKKTEIHILDITGENFTEVIDNLQDIYDATSEQAENVVAIIKGSKNIEKHLDFLFKNSEKQIILSTEKESEKPFFLENQKFRAKGIDTRTHNSGIRACIVDDEEVVLFPLNQEEVHPDYDLGIWIKNRQISKFLKRLITPN